MDRLAVERSIWIDAPRERVWQAMTEPEQLAQWFLPPEMTAMGAQLKRDEGGTMTMQLGPMSASIAIFEAFDPPRQITSRSLPDRLLTTTHTLDVEKDGTRVTVLMTGFEALPANAAQERLAPSGTAWEKALENLKAYIGGSPLPHTEGLIAALYGYRRESPQTMAIERAIWINAPRERVWQAITDPAQIQQWFSPGASWKGTGLHVGGRLAVYDPDSGAELAAEVIEVLEPPARLVTRSELPSAGHRTTWMLEAENGGTRLILTHSGYEQAAEDTRYNSMEQNAFGFGMMLENLKAQIEGQPLPFPGGF